MFFDDINYRTYEFLAQSLHVHTSAAILTMPESVLILYNKNTDVKLWIQI